MFFLILFCYIGFIAFSSFSYARCRVGKDKKIHMHTHMHVYLCAERFAVSVAVIVGVPSKFRVCLFSFINCSCCYLWFFFNSMPKTYPYTTVHHLCLRVAVVAVNCPNCRHFLLNRSGNVA